MRETNGKKQLKGLDGRRAPLLFLMMFCNSGLIVGRLVVAFCGAASVFGFALDRIYLTPLSFHRDRNRGLSGTIQNPSNFPRFS